MSNLLKAILNFEKNRGITLKDYTQKNSNRANSMGDALEYYIKDLFCNTLNEEDEISRNKKYSEVFSYLGNASNPPDIILRGGDAIEVKKLEGKGKSSIALNSSFPKDKLYSKSPMITKACKECEDWVEKDILYVIGSIEKKEITSLWIVYGDCYAANKGIYERIKDKISGGIKEIENIELSETKELGKLHKVDPLGITSLRIRGMWHIDHPYKVFQYLKQDSESVIHVLISENKYKSFPKEDRDKVNLNKNIVLKDIEIKNPNNPANLIQAKYISVKRG